MPTIDSVQQYLDSIYPSTSTEAGIAVRLGLDVVLDVRPALAWLITQRRAVAVESSTSGVVQFQSTKSVRAVSRGFNGSMDS